MDDQMSSSDKLRFYLQDFSSWAKAIEKSNDGWECDYPKWNEFIQAGEDGMNESGPSDIELLSNIADVWSISEEPESMHHIVENRPKRYVNILPSICLLGDWKARFQIYSLSKHTGLGSRFALCGTYDQNDYVVRRSLVAMWECNRTAAMKRASQLVACNPASLQRDSTLKRVANEIANGTFSAD